MTDSPIVLGDRYELRSVIGRGGMAEVWQARDLRLGREVAVKRLRADLATDPTFQTRFQREAQSAAGLNHPNIVSVYDTGSQEDSATGVMRPYIVMELVSGHTLREILHEGRTIVPAKALEYTAGVLDALSFSHKHGIIHRDIKPANVMITPSGQVKVMDFGIARAVADTSATMTQTAAVIGSTGSGKSTLADLLLRLHDVGEGAIRVDGADVRALTQEELRERIGCVPQKAFLFSGTIAENLRMGQPDATDEVLWRALGIAQAADFVERLPLGLDAPVAQGGTNFSGGQRQRLSIARALVKDAGVLLFDDSFSALDVKTDAALRRALREQVVRPAKLIVAQRVSTILDADLILVLDEGRLVGAGTHGELLETCPVYRAIADSQMQREGA